MRQGGAANRYAKVTRLAASGVKRVAGDGRAEEVTVVMGALMMGRGMFSTGISLWLTTSPGN